jgi:hypothetical protein
MRDNGKLVAFKLRVASRDRSENIVVSGWQQTSGSSDCVEGDAIVLVCVGCIMVAAAIKVLPQRERDRKAELSEDGWYSQAWSRCFCLGPSGFAVTS